MCVMPQCEPWYHERGDCRIQVYLPFIQHPGLRLPYYMTLIVNVDVEDVKRQYLILNGKLEL